MKIDKINNRKYPCLYCCGVYLLLCVFSSQLFAGLMDPLSTEELAALNLRFGVSATAPARAESHSDSELSSQPHQSRSNEAVLLVERHPHSSKAKNTPRLADFYIYNYAQNILVKRTINVSSNIVESSLSIRGYQLPLIPDEVKSAVDIAFNDPLERQRLNAEYLRISAKVLNSSADIDFKAFTFYGDSLSTRVNNTAQQCGEHRCAQLLFYTRDNKTFNFSLIIDLSTRKVAQNIGF